MFGFCDLLCWLSFVGDVVAQPLDRVGQTVDPAEVALDGGDHEVARILALDVVTTWAIASRSQQSSAKTTRTFSPLSLSISNQSEHERRVERPTATRPLVA